MRLPCTECGSTHERCGAARAAGAIKCCPDCRHPAWTGSTALVPWAPRVRFNHPSHVLAFPEVRYLPPSNSMDPRYAACRVHWVACDCREGHMAEDRAELRYYAAENRRFEDAIDAVLALHGQGESGACSDPACFGRYPCPTRNLLAPLSWREQYKSRENA